MSVSTKQLTWWDREIDDAGRPIRPDVRLAAQEIWQAACRRTQAVLADNAAAAELMECSVAQVSRYLDRHSAPSRACKMNGLLLLAFSRALKRRASKVNRIESIGGSSDLANRTADDSWSRQVDARLDLERIVRHLSERSSTALALRWSGFEWKEIAQILGTSVATVRNGFWREINQLRQEALVGKPCQPPTCTAG